MSKAFKFVITTTTKNKREKNVIEMRYYPVVILKRLFGHFKWHSMMAKHRNIIKSMRNSISDIRIWMRKRTQIIHGIDEKAIISMEIRIMEPVLYQTFFINNSNDKGNSNTISLPLGIKFQLCCWSNWMNDWMNEWKKLFWNCIAKWNDTLSADS